MQKIGVFVALCMLVLSACFIYLPFHVDAAVTVTGISVNTDKEAYVNGSMATATAVLGYSGNKNELSPVDFTWYYPNGTVAFLDSNRPVSNAVATSTWTADWKGTGFRVNATYTGTPPTADEKGFEVINGTNVEGIISTNTTWSLMESPYFVTDNITIADGATLTIEPGVVVRFNLRTGLYVNGALRAEGLLEDQIEFRSNYEIPLAFDWDSIRFNSGSDDASSVIIHSVIHHATNGLYLENSSPVIRNNLISDNFQSGIFMYGSHPVVENNTIRDNIVWDGNYTYGYGRGITAVASDPTIRNNTIKDNFKIGVKLQNSNGTLENNRIEGHTDGLALITSATLIQKNTIVGNSNGIKLEQLSMPLIEDNDISYNTYDGIQLFYHSMPTITNNTLEGNGRSGLWAHNAINVTLGGNTIRDSTHGIKTDFSENLSVINNTLVNNTYAFYLDRNSSVRIDNTTILSSVTRDFHILENTHVVSTDTSENLKVTVGKNSTLTIRNYLRIEAKNKTEAPIEGASVTVRDNIIHAYSGTTSEDGLTDRILLTDRIYYGSSVPVQNITYADVSYSTFPFVDNPRSVAMEASHTETFRIDNLKPDVAFTSPTEGSEVNGTVAVKGTATDPDGVIAGVWVRIDGGYWQEANCESAECATWEYGWNTHNFANGLHTLEARAKDDDGGYSSNPALNLSIYNPGNNPPTLNITSHSDGGEVAETVTVRGSAADSDGNVVEVYIWVDDGLWELARQEGSTWSNWSYSWNTSLYDNGEHTFGAIAADDEGAPSFPGTEVVLIVNNSAEGSMPDNASKNFMPNVVLSSPSGGDTVNETVMVRGTSNDTDGFVSLVELRIDGGPWTPASNLANDWSLWSYLWDTTGFPNGEHTIETRAVDDMAALSLKRAVTVTVDNGENMPPSVQITSHTDGAGVNGSAVIGGTSSDSDGAVTEVWASVDGTSWHAAKKDGDDWETWSFHWNTTKYSNGPHEFQVRAKDDFGAYSSVKKVQFIVANSEAFPPSVTLASHDEGDVVEGNILLSGEAVDWDGQVESVGIKMDGEEWKPAEMTDAEWRGWQYMLNTSNYPNGELEMALRAIDDSGLVSDECTIRFVVANPQANTPPVLVMESKLHNSTVSGWIVILGSVFDLDGSITSMEVRIDSGQWVEIGFNSSSGRWEYLWNSSKVANGNHTITVRAVDCSSTETYSSMSVIVINAPLEGGNDDDDQTPAVGEGSIDLWSILPVLLAGLAAVALALVFLMIRRKRESEE